MLDYYSELVVTMSPRLTNIFEALIEHHETMENLCNSANIYEPSKDGLLLKWERVRWYQGFSPIDDFMNFLSGFAEEEFKYIRIGEDTDDIEHFGKFHGIGVRLIQKIEIDA